MVYSIFISYRRKNATWFAGRLYDNLKNKFKGVEIFMDVDEINGGEIFKRKIDKAINDCTVFLPIIDQEWATIKDDRTGKKRLFMKEDFIVFEVERAIFLGKTIIPVLMGNSSMPLQKELPEAIRSLPKYNAIKINPESWHRDIENLFKTLASYSVMPKKKYDVFISAPMTAYSDSKKYENTRRDIEKIIKFLNQYCKWDNIYFAGHKIGNIKNIDPEDISALSDLSAIRESEYFLLLYPERLLSSCLVEAGYALALEIPSIYFCKNEADLPYMLRRSSSAYSFVHSYRYTTITSLNNTIEKFATSILKLKVI